jgi:putative membrane protein
MPFLIHILISACLLMIVSATVRGVTVDGLGSALFGAFALSLVNALIKPIIVLLTLPLTILTFGLFLLVINAMMLRLMSSFVPGIRIASFDSAFFGAIVLSVLSLIVDWYVLPAVMAH